MQNFRIEWPGVAVRAASARLKSVFLSQGSAEHFKNFQLLFHGVQAQRLTALQFELVSC